MKPITLYVSDEIYSSYQMAAVKKNTKAAVLIRNAMEFFLKEKLSKQTTFAEWKPVDLGNVKKDWVDNSFREEMFDARY